MSKTEPVSTALVVKMPEMLADYEGMSFVDDGNTDIAPSWPIVRIVQATSKMEGASKHAGEFWHRDRYEDDPKEVTSHYTAEMEGVVLQKQNTRSLFEDGGETPACSSADGVVPLPTQPLWQKPEVLLKGQRVRVGRQPSKCFDCPFSWWGQDNTPPPCSEAYALLFLRNDTGSIAMMRLSGTAIKPYRVFVSALQRKRLPIYTQMVRFYTSEQSSASKKWQQLEIDSQNLPRTEVEKVLGLVEASRAAFQSSATRTIEQDAPARSNSGGWDDGAQWEGDQPLGAKAPSLFFDWEAFDQDLNAARITPEQLTDLCEGRAAAELSVPELNLVWNGFRGWAAKVAASV